MLVEKLSKLSSSSRNALSAALVLIAAVAMYRWLVAPHVTYLFAVQRYEPILQDVAQKKQNLRNSVTVKRKRLVDLEEEFSNVVGEFFTSEQAGAFFAEIPDIAGREGCPVSAVSFQPAQAGPTLRYGGKVLVIRSRAASLTVTGQYNSVMALLGALGDRQQRVWVDSLRMELSDVTTGILRCTISISIHTIEDQEVSS